jgi:glycosyltransferase involved in cell wall biosynthesis
MYRLASPMLARQIGIPTVVTLHELVELTDCALDAPAATSHWRAAYAIATQADMTCLTMRHYADRLTARGLDCAHIAIGAYHQPELLEESDIQELLFFTTLAPFKGLELLLDAFQILCRDYPKLQLTIAGTEHTRFPNYAGVKSCPMAE